MHKALCFASFYRVVFLTDFSPNFGHLFKKRIYIWLQWIFTAARQLSLVTVGGGYCLLQGTGCSFQWLFLLWSTAVGHVGLSSCGTWLTCSSACGIFPDQDWTRLLSIGRRILNHWTSRKVQVPHFFFWSRIANFSSSGSVVYRICCDFRYVCILTLHLVWNAVVELFCPVRGPR